MTEPNFRGKIGISYKDSEPDWLSLPSSDGAPNVLVILLDDTGFGNLGCYGSTIETPNMDALAANGLRYNNFHVTPLCSPTRASLLTGRNHHSVGMSTIVDGGDAGFPNRRSRVSRHAATLAEMLSEEGFATFALGKWHLNPSTQNSAGGSREEWPLQRGFDRFYGFLPGATDQFYPELTYDNHPVSPPKTPEEGYHLTEDLVDRAIEFVNDLKAMRPETPFFMYFAPGAMHNPHQAPKEYIDKYKGRFDEGWDVIRERYFQK
jgi:arylsulfatase